MKQNKKQKEKDKIGKGRVLANNWFVLRYLFRQAPFLVVGVILLHAAVTVPWTLSDSMLLKYIIDVVMSGENLTRIVWAVGAFAVMITISEFCNFLFYYVYFTRSLEKVMFRLNSDLYQKAMQTDLAAYDDPEYYNDFVFAMQSAQERVENTLRHVSWMFESVLTVAALSALLTTIDPVCLGLILGGSIAIIPLSASLSGRVMKKQEEINPLKRKGMYFLRLFTMPYYAKELRLNAVVPLLNKRYAQAVEEHRLVARKHSRPLWKREFFLQCMPPALLICLLVTGYTGYRVMVSKTLSVGDFVATFNAAASVSTTLFYVAAWGWRGVRENGLFIEKIRTFLDYETKIKDGAQSVSRKKPETIRFTNVSFCYPGNAEPSLKQINLEIEPYQKVALVGYNGAGKTTLTNLLMRLYDVSEGAITIGGQDIRENTLKKHKAQFSAVFQDYKLFAATLGENVARGSAINPERVYSSLRESGFTEKLEGLPNGIETQLLREFDDEGVQLSGGEEQKVAIAGAMYQNCPFIILDEPSANLDPVSEYNLNLTMAKAAEQKTVIFISHRLSTTRMADKIYMMEKGEIVEEGTHDALMAQNGKYAYMFRLQAEKYL